MIESLEHVGLSVADLERSIAFYRDVLGFTLTRIVESPPAMPLGDVVGLPGCAARIAHLVLGGTMLEVFEYHDPEGRPIPPDRTQADRGFIHIGLRSSDTCADHARLAARGFGSSMIPSSSVPESGSPISRVRTARCARFARVREASWTFS